jgi:hypothetical protein
VLDLLEEGESGEVHTDLLSYLEYDLDSSVL